MSAGEGKVGFVTDIGAKECGESQIYWSAFATDAALEKSTVNRDDYDDASERGEDDIYQRADQVSDRCGRRRRRVCRQRRRA